MPATGLFSFELQATDPGSLARLSTFHTPHGPVEMPAFMPVGTQGTVKGLPVELIAATGAQMILANTYHLALRPGAEVVAALGGLHQFCGWLGPILSDSGGFQVFSLAENVQVDEQGVTFRSHLDGNPFALTPEKAVAIQEQLGVDVAMVLDHVVALPGDRGVVRDAAERTVRWAERSLAAQTRGDQALFAIVQGGLEPDLRVDCAERLAALDFPGYAVGGLSVGEEPAEMYRVLDYTVPALPADRPRYLMGVGRPQDLLAAIARGIDLFDCVLPTRNGRNALAYTDAGPIRLRNRQYQLDSRPLADDCSCLACRHSRGYLRHLFMAGEMLGPVLLSLHNLTYYQQLLRSARQAITAGRFDLFHQQKLAGWA
ncbi:MAG TPA: tRNA guanosine(34) transglycosylase Tgt [Pirellulales bacterium]|nr:tRNA guanosine(34) transglycosylase Tgt [Pirellulales bacterium]